MIALVAGDGELVGDGGAFVLQAMADGAGRAVEVLGSAGCLLGKVGRRLQQGHGGGLGDLLQRFLEGRGGQDDRLCGDLELIAGLGFESLDVGFGGGLSRGQLGHHAAAGGIQRRGLLLGVHAGIQWLRALGAVAVDGHGFDALAPALGVGLGNLLDGGLLGQVDGLGDCAGEERLRGGHHLHVAHVMNRAGALQRLEAAIEDGQVLGLDARRALDGAGGVNVADDGVHFVVRRSRA